MWEYNARDSMYLKRNVYLIVEDLATEAYTAKRMHWPRAAQVWGNAAGTGQLAHMTKGQQMIAGAYAGGFSATGELLNPSGRRR
jgi:hypothetical protein